MIECFNFIDVLIKDQLTQARPVEWDREIADGCGNDKDGNQVVPIRFHCTCPFCGNLIDFHFSDMFYDSDGNSNNIKCNNCKVGKDPIPMISLSASEFINDVALIDPISSGLFNVDVDFELLQKFDSIIA